MTLIALPLGLLIPLIQNHPMTLQEAVDFAVQKSQAVKLADTNVEKARLKISEAGGALGPKLTANGTYTRFDKGQTTFDGSAGPADSKTANLTLSWPLDLAGATRQALYAAKVNMKAQEAVRAGIVNDLAANVKLAYASVLKAQASAKVAEEAVARAQERKDLAQKEVDAGTRAKVDVMRLETTLVESQSSLVAAKNGVELAKASFNQVLGRAIETPVDLSGMDWWTPESKTEPELIALAMKERPEMRALNFQLETLKFVRLATGIGMLPSLNFSIQHVRNFGPLNSFSREQSTTGVISVSIPLYDSGITKSRVAQARQDEEAVKVQAEQTSLRITLEVRQAVLNLSSADERVKLAAKQKELAAENYRLSVLRFDNQQGIALEVADASTQLAGADTALVNARFDYLTAIAQLERAVASPLKPQNP